MSERNGDKSRFHRERRQKAARRARNRALRQGTQPVGQQTASTNGKKLRSK
jgi:hypothetical protein